VSIDKEFENIKKYEDKDITQLMYEHLVLIKKLKLHNGDKE
jgi:hypothetical protein